MYNYINYKRKFNYTKLPLYYKYNNYLLKKSNLSIPFSLWSNDRIKFTGYFIIYKIIPDILK